MEEYEALRCLCEHHDVRSVSEFARTAVLGRMDTINRRTLTTGEDLTTLQACLQDLDGSLRQLSGHIATVLGRRTEQARGKADAQTVG